jgi:hypothetical protein
MYVSGVNRYPQARHDAKFDLDVVEGTERVDLFFDGPADETLTQLQTPSLFFYPDVPAARRTYRAQIARTKKASDNLFGVDRNVVILWVRPDVPQRLRAIVRGCLRP